MGLKEFFGYIRSSFYNKKLCVSYGNCHIGAIAHYLSKNYSFAKQYAVLHYHVDENNPQNEWPSDEELQYASLVIMHDIREENKLTIPGVENIKKRASNNTKIVVIPNLWGMNFLWPQCDEKRALFGSKLVDIHLNDKAIHPNVNWTENEKRIKRSMIVGLIDHKDDYIEKNIDKDTDSIVREIKGGPYIQRV